MVDATEHRGLVYRTANRMGRYLPTHVDRDDLVGWGMIGLMDACKKFDSSRSVPFAAYALIRIRGAILDGLRSMDPAGRKKVEGVVTVSLDQQLESGHLELAGPEDLEADIIRKEQREQVVDAVRQLPPMERMIVVLSYWEGRSLREIGSIYGLTESRMCQIRQKALRRLGSLLPDPVEYAD